MCCLQSFIDIIALCACSYLTFWEQYVMERIKPLTSYNRTFCTFWLNLNPDRVNYRVLTVAGSPWKCLNFNVVFSHLKSI